MKRPQDGQKVLQSKPDAACPSGMLDRWYSGAFLAGMRGQTPAVGAVVAMIGIVRKIAILTNDFLQWRVVPGTRPGLWSPNRQPYLGPWVVQSFASLGGGPFAVGDVDGDSLIASRRRAVGCFDMGGVCCRSGCSRDCLGVVDFDGSPLADHFGA